jgi:hypothetical protein
MKRTGFEIVVALITASLVALAGALNVIDKLHGHDRSRLGCSASSGDGEFLDRFRSEGGDAGNCWENFEQGTEDSL